MTIKKNIKGYEGIYEITSEGDVISLERWVNRGKAKQYVPEIKRKLSEHGTGYLTVRLASNGLVKTCRVHILVAQAFIPNPDNKPFVNHKDGNKHNNRIDNLEWVTAKENTEHFRRSAGDSILGFNHPSSKFDKSTVSLWSDEIKKGKRIKDIALDYNCDRNTVSRLVKKIN